MLTTGFVKRKRGKAGTHKGCPYKITCGAEWPAVPRDFRTKDIGGNR